MTIGELLREARQILLAAGIENCGFEAELLASQIFKRDRVFFYTHGDDSVAEALKEAYLVMVERRAAHEPVAYILAHKEFMGLNFLVNADVLIPRPDTEAMVEELISWLKNVNPRGKKVLDLCTGSGAIGIVLKYFYPEIEMTLSDYSEKALQIAGENANVLVNGRVDLMHSDLFEKFSPNAVFDLIVSNPPYIPSGEIPKLAQDIYEYEPTMALDGGATGLDFYRRIAAEAKSYLKSGGMLALEIGDHQEDDVIELLKQNGFLQIQKIADLTGLVRAITAKKPDSTLRNVDDVCDDIC
ncbi:peptide chain release factor N(5)-glutamine methyltransferase [Eubacteriaceae bacterium ES2]|nr:peptide chain release factor N(5)-glutamine methyltransferase [Eubacteriaceae bacterium ES2]